MKKLLIIFVLTTTLVSTAQESVLLRVNYNQGDQYEMNMDMTQDMGASGGMHMNMKMSMDVKNVSDTIFNTEIHFKTVAMEMNQAGTKMAYDSEKPNEDLNQMEKQLKAGFDPLLEATILVKNNHLGKVLETKFEPNNPALKDYADQSSGIVFPKKAVKVGDSWEMIKEKNGIKMKFVYTVKSIDKDTVVLDVSGDISNAAEGTINGSIEIDRSTGMQQKSTLGMEMKVMGQNVITRIESTIKKAE